MIFVKRLGEKFSSTLILQLDISMVIDEGGNDDAVICTAMKVCSGLFLGGFLAVVRDFLSHVLNVDLLMLFSMHHSTWFLPLE